MKTNILILYLFFLISILFSCAPTPFTVKRSLTEFPTKQEHIPPGTVEIKNNLFMDYSEILNIDYNDFLHYTTRGNRAENYIKLSYDSTIWYSPIYGNKKGLDSIEHYYQQHPAYKYHPEVGISWEQANIYCKWRTDRVFELMVIRLNNLDRDFLSYNFTVDNYFENKPAKDYFDNTLLIPYYFLPSREEWIISAGKLNKENNYNTFDSSRMENGYYPEGNCIKSESYESKPNKFGVIDMIGNVAEMTDIKGIALGGSWFHPFPKTINQIYNYDKPEAWVGFRCACKYVTYEEYKKLTEDKHTNNSTNK